MLNKSAIYAEDPGNFVSIGATTSLRLSDAETGAKPSLINNINSFNGLQFQIREEGFIYFRNTALCRHGRGPLHRGESPIENPETAHEFVLRAGLPPVQPGEVDFRILRAP